MSNYKKKYIESECKSLLDINKIDYHIVDWDLTRWYQEEDRKKHPEYYNNTVKLELVETYVRSLFDEICIIIEGAEKEVRYTRSVMVV